MPDPQPTKLQPLTPAGVARFAHASLLKVFGICFFFAALGGAAVLWTVARCWAPVISEAAVALPTNSVIEAGQFFWPEKVPRLLAANQFLGIEVNPDPTKPEGIATDLSFTIETRGLRIGSIFGYTFLPYPQRWIVQLNRETVLPIWGAWQPAILTAVAVGAIFGLMFCWSLMALLYTFYPWLVAALFKRDLTLGAAWKLCYAALMPGAVLMTFSVLLYSTGRVSLIFVLILTVAHLVLGWIYIFFASFFLRKAPVLVDNPFQPEKKKMRKSSKNPFRGSDPDED